MTTSSSCYSRRRRRCRTGSALWLIGASWIGNCGARRSRAPCSGKNIVRPISLALTSRGFASMTRRGRAGSGRRRPSSVGYSSHARCWMSPRTDPLTRMAKFSVSVASSGRPTFDRPGPVDVYSRRMMVAASPGSWSNRFVLPSEKQRKIRAADNYAGIGGQAPTESVAVMRAASSIWRRMSGVVSDA